MGGVFLFYLVKPSLNIDELNNWKSQIVISNKEKMGLRKPPTAFTEQGVAMLSSVLNSETSIEVNIHIIRIFTRIREALLHNKG
ncbi:MAG: ORF6N domain-containing protein [Bacteroidota bacterium]